MKTISIFVLVVIHLANLARGMDCPQAEANNFSEAIPSCPRPEVDSSEKSFCCMNMQARSMSCCDSLEWMIQETRNAAHASAPSLQTTKLQQTGSILFSIYFGHFIIGKFT